MGNESLFEISNSNQYSIYTGNQQGNHIIVKDLTERGKQQ